MTDEEWSRTPQDVRMWLIEMALRYGKPDESVEDASRRIADVLMGNPQPAEEEALDAPLKPNWRTDRGLDG